MLKTMVHKHFEVSVFCLFLIFIYQTLIADELKLTILSEELPPLSYKNQQTGMVEGICTDLIREVLKHTDINYEINLLPWARALRTAETKRNTLIYSIGRIPERENKFNWLNKIHTINYYLYALKNNTTIVNTSEDELKKLTVAVSLDDVNYVYLKKNGFQNIVHINDYKQMFELLKRKRVDLLASNDLGVKLYNKTYPEFGIEVVPVKGFVVPEVELYFAINKNADEHLVQQLLQGFNKVIEDGSYQTILSPITDLR